MSKPPSISTHTFQQSSTKILPQYPSTTYGSCQQYHYEHKCLLNPKRLTYDSHHNTWSLLGSEHREQDKERKDTERESIYEEKRKKQS